MFIDFQRVLEVVGENVSKGKVLNWNSVYHQLPSLIMLLTFSLIIMVKVLRKVPKVNMLNEEYIVKTYFEILYIGDEGKSSVYRLCSNGTHYSQRELDIHD